MAGNSGKFRNDIKVIRLQKAMKPKALWGDQTFNQLLASLQ
jgi:hypothetical protein